MLKNKISFFLDAKNFVNSKKSVTFASAFQKARKHKNIE